VVQVAEDKEKVQESMTVVRYNRSIYMIEKVCYMLVCSWMLVIVCEIWLWEIEYFPWRDYWLYGKFCMRQIYRGTLLVILLFVVGTLY